MMGTVVAVLVLMVVNPGWRSVLEGWEGGCWYSS